MLLRGFLPPLTPTPFSPNSKITRDTYEEAIKAVLKGAQEKKVSRSRQPASSLRLASRVCALTCYPPPPLAQRNFRETVELQVMLKNYDPARDKRFSGTMRLPSQARPGMNVCVLGDQSHIDEAKANDIPCMDVEALKKLKKNKKLVKKLGTPPCVGRESAWPRDDAGGQGGDAARHTTDPPPSLLPTAKKYDAFLASPTLIKQIPRILGPGLNKAGKFPSLVNHEESLVEKVAEMRATIKFQMKKVLTLGIAVGHVEMTEEDLMTNVVQATNFLVSLLKKVCLGRVKEKRAAGTRGVHATPSCITAAEPRCDTAIFIPLIVPLAFSLRPSQRYAELAKRPLFERQVDHGRASAPHVSLPLRMALVARAAPAPCRGELTLRQGPVRRRRVSWGRQHRMVLP